MMIATDNFMTVQLAPGSKAKKVQNKWVGNKGWVYF
jgi:hypothetical protein